MVLGLTQVNIHMGARIGQKGFGTYIMKEKHDSLIN